LVYVKYIKIEERIELILPSI